MTLKATNRPLYEMFPSHMTTATPRSEPSAGADRRIPRPPAPKPMATAKMGSSAR